MAAVLIPSIVSLVHSQKLSDGCEKGSWWFAGSRSCGDGVVGVGVCVHSVLGFFVIVSMANIVVVAVALALVLVVVAVVRFSKG